MSGSHPLAALLRQLSPGGIASLEFYPLPHDGEVKLGRDPSCQIVLDSRVHTGVSRQHAKVEVVRDRSFCWQICDLNSSNGTYVNGERLWGCRILEEGDRISLGKQGPLFVFEVLPIDLLNQSQSGNPNLLPTSSTADVRTNSSIIFEHSDPSKLPSEYREPQRSPASGNVTFSQLFPIVSTGRDLTRKAYLLPGIITVLFVVLMFICVGNPASFNVLLAGYLSSAAYYFVYQLCGKRKPWWLLLGAALITTLLLVSPVLNLFIFIFREILPGAIPARTESVNILALMVQMFFGAGLMEELLKSIPVLMAAWVGATLSQPHAERFGVREPLDGILLGTASAVGFTLLETLGQYVPSIVGDVTFQAGAVGTAVGGELLGLQLLIPRILGSVSGHMAYSGYLGYFIGLSVLKPKFRWRILIIGYLSASLLHALWNTTGFINPVVLAMVGVLSYAFLAAAILKARALSPTRSQNFATRFTHLP